MDIIIPEIVKENSFAYAIGVTFALFGVALKIIKGSIGIYEDALVKRYLKRLESLSNRLEDSATTEYIKKLKESEIFRLASGINTSPEKSKMLMNIYSLDVVDNRDLKRIYSYLVPKGNLVEVTVNYFDIFFFVYSFLLAISLFILGIILWVLFAISGSGVASLSGLFVLVVFIALGLFVGRDYQTFHILKKVREQLIEKEIILNPNNPQWKIGIWFSQFFKSEKEKNNNY